MRLPLIPFDTRNAPAPMKFLFQNGKFANAFMSPALNASSKRWRGKART